MATSLCRFEVTVFSPKLGRTLTRHTTAQIPCDAVRNVKARIRKEFDDPDMELRDPRTKNLGFVSERHAQLRLRLKPAS